MELLSGRSLLYGVCIEAFEATDEAVRRAMATSSPPVPFAVGSCQSLPALWLVKNQTPDSESAASIDRGLTNCFSDLSTVEQIFARRSAKRLTATVGAGWHAVEARC